MNRLGIDNKVKKKLVRDCEEKVRPTTRVRVTRDVLKSRDHISNIVPKKYGSLQKENELNQPTLCSSEVLANYLSDVKKSTPPKVTDLDLNVDRGELCAKMTKKLNFPLNNRIYKNLVELNASHEEYRTKKDRRQTNVVSSKKDLEPNIEDFCEDEKEIDSAPSIPVLKPKFKPIKKLENGQLHNLVAAFEVL